MYEADARTTLGLVSDFSGSVVPSASDTIRQQIIDILDARLKTILKANGYKTDAGNNVSRFKENPWEVGDMPCIEYRDTSDKPEDLSVGLYLHTISLKISAFYYGSTADDSARELMADIETCIGTDLTMSGLAEDTKQTGGPEDISIEHNDRKIAGIILEFEIEYTSERFNPYS